MDIFSHGLWAGVVYKVVNIKTLRWAQGKRALNVWWGTFWGIFPDLFAFTIPFVWIFWHLWIVGDINTSMLPRPENIEPTQADTIPIFRLASTLYNFSHSTIIFFIVFGIVYLILKRPIWELGGWLLHILIDIPTHSYKFFPTPFLWPISQWKFNGFSWGTKWFLVVNYSLLLIVYIVIWLWRKRINR